MTPGTVPVLGVLSGVPYSRVPPDSGRTGVSFSLTYRSRDSGTRQGPRDRTQSLSVQDTSGTRRGMRDDVVGTPSTSLVSCQSTRLLPCGFYQSLLYLPGVGVESLVLGPTFSHRLWSRTLVSGVTGWSSPERRVFRTL